MSSRQQRRANQRNGRRKLVPVDFVTQIDTTTDPTTIYVGEESDGDEPVAMSMTLIGRTLDNKGNPVLEFRRQDGETVYAVCAESLTQ